MPSSNWNLRSETSASTTTSTSPGSIRPDSIQLTTASRNRTTRRKPAPFSAIRFSPFLLFFPPIFCPPVPPPRGWWRTNRGQRWRGPVSFPGRSDPAVAVIDASTDGRSWLDGDIGSRNLWRVPLFTGEEIFFFFSDLFWWDELWTERGRFSFVKNCSFLVNFFKRRQSKIGMFLLDKIRVYWWNFLEIMKILRKIEENCN